MSKEFKKGTYVELRSDKKVYWTPKIYVHRLATIINAGSRGYVISDGKLVSGDNEEYYDVEFTRHDGWIGEVRCDPDELKEVDTEAWKKPPPNPDEANKPGFRRGNFVHISSTKTGRVSASEKPKGEDDK